MTRVLFATTVTIGVLFTGLILAHAWAQGEPIPYTKNAMCIACHKGRNPGLLEHYQSTKHSQAVPEADMAPVDIYRRSVGFHSADNSYYEKGVGCQSCHAPGGPHLKSRTDDEKKTTMRRVDSLEKPTQKLSVCGRCHGDYTVNGKPFAEDFKVGDDLFAIEGFKLNEITTPGPFQELDELESSEHGAHDVTCINCHTSHEDMQGKPQLRQAVPDLCLQCHGEAHKCTVPADQVKAGDTCATCHMPHGRHVFKVVK